MEKYRKTGLLINLESDTDVNQIYCTFKDKKWVGDRLKEKYGKRNEFGVRVDSKY